MIENLDDLAADVVERAKKERFDLKGPARTEVGYGWAPTVSFWSGDRRVHFYFESHQGRVYVVAEVSQMGPPRVVQVGRLETTDQAWRIVDLFLQKGRGFEALPDHDWIKDVPTHDEQIPHPPDRVFGQVNVGLAAKVEPPSRGKIQGVVGVTLYSSNPAQLAAWYRDVLGLEWAEKEGVYHAMLGPSQFAIYTSDAAGGASPQAMVTLKVDDAKTFQARAQAKRAEVLGEEQTASGKFLYLRDSDGNPLELWQPA